MSTQTLLIKVSQNPKICAMPSTIYSYILTAHNQRSMNVSVQFNDVHTHFSNKQAFYNQPVCIFYQCLALTQTDKFSEPI